jgi:hypothetical protein
MRQLALPVTVTMDGYVARGGGELGWGFPPEHPGVPARKLPLVRYARSHIMELS